jgi:deoxyadenosine/deoxycytidine kinase
MEQSTPVEYWIEMHKRYESWINSFNACPVLRINIRDYDLMKEETSIEPIIERIGYFLKQTQLLKK